MTSPLTFIFFGRSGSGKGTQAHLLADYLNEQGDRKALYIETGQKFRDFVKESDTFSAKLTRDVLDRGGLMPEFLPIWIWADFLVKNFSGEEHLVLDGLSRRVDEAPVLENALKFYKREKIFVVYLNVSRETAFSFMKGRGRKDDTDEYINSRLDWFDESVLPVIEHFKHSKNVTFLDIDGSKSIPEVHNDILKASGLAAS